MSNNYSIPAQQHLVEIEVKKSRFIAIADHVSSRVEALEKIEIIKQRYPDARHHCWAYQLGSPNSPTNAAMNDDGEPSGTAGKPILNVIQHKGIGDLLVVVVRYFGGVKLGAGGLVRAYGSASDSVINELETTEVTFKLSIELRLDFSQEQLVRHWLSQLQGSIDDVNYTNQVVMQVSVAEESLSELEKQCASSGIKLTKC